MRSIAKPVLVLGTLLAAFFLAAFAAGPASATTNTPASTVSTVSSTDTAPAAASPSGDVSAQAYVGIPGNYVYNPDLGSLHDYCTWSPDAWFSADFRGPCARHDMCYEAHTAGKAACDNGFHSNLISNCNYFYPGGSSTCLAAADTYYAAVVQFGGYSTEAQPAKQTPERVTSAGTTAAPDLG